MKVKLTLSFLLLIILYFTQPIEASATEYRVNIGDIYNTFDENPIVTLLNNATKKDIIHFYINSDGGVVSKAYKIINAVYKSKGKVYMHVIKARSAAAIIAASGNRMYYTYNSSFMFHLARTSKCLTYVLIGEYCILDISDPAQQKYLGYFDSYAKKFLTNKEYCDMLKGKDIYISGKQMKKRLQ